MPNTDTTTRHLAQLREDLANARECGNDTVEVPTGALEAVLAELDRVRKTQAPTHIHFKFDDLELTAPIGSGADRVHFDWDPGSETYRFSPRGITVNKAKLRGVRLLTPAEMAELDLDPNTLLNWRTPRKELP